MNTNNDGWVEYPNTEHLSWRRGRMEFPDQDVVRAVYRDLDELIGKTWLCFQRYEVYIKGWVDLTEPPVWEPWNIYRMKPVDHYAEIDIPYPEPCKLCNVGRGCDGSCY